MGSTNLHDAARKGDLAATTSLLRSNPDLAFCKNSEDETPLEVAEKAGHMGVVEAILTCMLTALDSEKGKNILTPRDLRGDKKHLSTIDVSSAYRARLNTVLGIKCFTCKGGGYKRSGNGGVSKCPVCKGKGKMP